MAANHADLIARLRAFLKVWGGAGELQLYPALISTANEVADALASCEAAMEEMRRKWEDLRTLWVAEGQARAAAESALATERARVVEECAKMADDLKYGSLWASDADASQQIAAAIRALIPTTPQTEQESAP